MPLSPPSPPSLSPPLSPKKARRGRWSKPLSLAFAAAALALSTAVRAAVPGILKQVPDDAMVVFMIKDLKALNTQVANYQTRLGLAGQQDPLTMIANNLNINQAAIDRNGSLAFVVMSPAAGGGGGGQNGPPAVMLVPTTDAKALLEPFKPSAPENGISTITLPNNDQEGYVATVDKYVALSQNKDLLTAFIQHKASLDTTIPADAQASFENNDAVLYLNSPVIAKQFLPQLDMMRNMIKGAMTSNPQVQNKQMAGAIFDTYFNGIKQFLTDSQATLVTAHLTDEGADLGFSGHFTPGSPTANLAAAQKPLATNAIKDVPTNNYLLAGSASIDPKTFTEIMTAAQNNMTKPDDGTPPPPNAAALQRYFDLTKQAAALITGDRFVLYAPSGQAGAGLVNAAVVMDSADPAKSLDLLHRSVNDKEGMSAFVNGGPVKMESKITPNGATSHGLSFDTITYAFSASGADTQKAAGEEAPTGAPDPEAMIKTIYGDKGFVIHTGKVNDKLVMSIGGDQQTLDGVVEAVQHNTTANADLDAASKAAQKNAMAVVYMPVEKWIDLAMQHAKNPNQPVNAVAMGGGSGTPTVMSVATTPQSITSLIHVPMNTILKIGDVAKQRAGMVGPGQ